MVTLNTKGHFINDILSEDNFSAISTEVFYISSSKKLDCIYKSCEVSMDEDVKDWYLKETIFQLKKLRSEDGFSCYDYNNEISIKDSIAVIDTRIVGGVLKERLNLLKEAIVSDNGDLDKCKFHLLKASLNEKKIYFGYYKGLKKFTARKKILFIEGSEFKEIKDPVVELGGKIDFILFEEFIYVINPQHFEFAFLYSDHITKLRDENLEKITNMDIFKEEKDKDFFKSNSMHHLMARGIAQIKEGDLKALKSNFDDRCAELREIKDRINQQPEKEKELRDELGILIDLTNYIDLGENKIIFNENDNPKSLLYLFEDKIMESFLTKKVTTILAKQS